MADLWMLRPLYMHRGKAWLITGCLGLCTCIEERHGCLGLCTCIEERHGCSLDA